MVPIEFQASEESGTVNELLSMYIYGSQIGSLGRNHFDPFKLQLNTSGKGHLGIATNQILSI